MNLAEFRSCLKMLEAAQGKDHVALEQLADRLIESGDAAALRAILTLLIPLETIEAFGTERGPLVHGSLLIRGFFLRMEDGMAGAPFAEPPLLQEGKKIVFEVSWQDKAVTVKVKRPFSGSPEALFVQESPDGPSISGPAPRMACDPA